MESLSYLALIYLAGVDPGLHVVDLLHENLLRDVRQVHTEGDDAFQLGWIYREVARPKAFAFNRLVSRFWGAFPLYQVLWILTLPSGKKSC